MKHRPNLSKKECHKKKHKTTILFKDFQNWRKCNNFDKLANINERIEQFFSFVCSKQVIKNNNKLNKQKYGIRIHRHKFQGNSFRL